MRTIYSLITGTGFAILCQDLNSADLYVVILVTYLVLKPEENEL